MQNGILLRCNHNSTGTHEFQLVLSESYRDEIMALGHDHQFKGSLSHRKATFHENMLRRYHDDRNPETDARACNMIVNETAQNNQDGDNRQDELLDPIGEAVPRTLFWVKN